MKTKRLIIAMIGAMICSVSYGQKVSDGGRWAVIDCSGKFRDNTLKNQDDVTFSKTTDGRIKRHTESRGLNGNPHVNGKISPKFAVAKSDINFAGQEEANPAPMVWNRAAGWIQDANSTLGDVAPHPYTCVRYGPANTGKKWRLPTQRELLLIWVLRKELESIPEFKVFANAGYWSGTECTSTTSWYVGFTSGVTDEFIKTGACKVRCVMDL